MGLKKVSLFENLSREVVNGAINTESDILERGFKFKSGKNIHDILEMKEAYLQGEDPFIKPCLNSMAKRFEKWLKEILDLVD